MQYDRVKLDTKYWAEENENNMIEVCERNDNIIK